MGSQNIFDNYDESMFVFVSNCLAEGMSRSRLSG